MGRRYPAALLNRDRQQMMDVIGELDLISGERVPVSVPIQIIPEPATFLLLAIGSLLLTRQRR